MTQARSTLVYPTITAFLDAPKGNKLRRAFLCGYDDHSHTDYEHRRQWLEE